MNRTIVPSLVFAALGLALFAPGAAAQSYISHQDHTMTFDTPVKLVTGVTMPAGTYRFNFPSPSQPGITRILSQDQSKVFAMLQTVSTERPSASGYNVVLISEGPPNSPRLLKAWFCDGNRIGHEFVAQEPTHKR